MTTAAIWALCGITSCAFFVYHEKHYIRGMDFFGCIFFTGALFGLCVLGPVGLILFLLASLMRYASNHLL